MKKRNTITATYSGWVSNWCLNDCALAQSNWDLEGGYQTEVLTINLKTHFSDGEEDIIFTTEEEKSCTEDDKSGDEIEEIPEDEESCIEPAEKSIEQIEDNIKEIKEKINNKMNRIEQAFKANDESAKEKSKVIKS